jgi:hypothetical protein
MLVAFLSGATVMGFWLAGLFFLRFWTRTRDQLFLAFTTSFWLLGLSQGLLSFSNAPVEERTPLYLLRLAAFLIILISVWRKNSRASK